MATRALILRPGYFPLFDKGKPVANGYIYIGEPDLDPEIVANRKAITFLQEDGSEVAGSQPVRTSAGGVPTYNGSPVTVLIDGDYSVKVLDRKMAQIYYVPKNADLQDADIVTSVQNIIQLQALTGMADGQTVRVTGYYPDGRLDTGIDYIYNADRSKSDHNGGSVISPSVPWDGVAGSSHIDFLDAVGETDPSGSGVWEVSADTRQLTAHMFGAPSGADVDGSILNRLGAAYGDASAQTEFVIAGGKGNYIINETVNGFDRGQIIMKGRPRFDPIAGFSSGDDIFYWRAFTNSGGRILNVEGAYTMFCQERGRNAITLSKLDGFMPGSPDIRDPGRAGIHLESVGDFSQIEEVYGHGVRIFGGQYGITAYIADTAGQKNFVNKVSWYDLELRGQSEWPIYVELAGTSPNDKAGEWTFINPQIDVGSADLDKGCVKFDRTGSGGQCNGWKFLGVTLEDSSPSGPARTGAAIQASHEGISDGIFVVSVRAKFPQTLDDNIRANGAFFHYDNSNLNVNPESEGGNFRADTGPQRMARLVTPDLHVTAGGRAWLQGMERFLTNDISGGDSFCGGSGTIVRTFPHNAFSTWRVTIYGESEDSSGQVLIVIRYTGSGFASIVSGLTGMSVNSFTYDAGDDDWTLTLNNTSGVAFDYRLSSVRER